ncbi:MAG TPA: hypothetical protein VMY69_04285 [Phycisphaerae bacterium]|nr:hypothetical protein [Phycisphaerae bacterium]
MLSRTFVLLCSIALACLWVAGCQKESPTKPPASATMESPRRLEPQVEPLPPRETPAEAPKPATETPAPSAETPAEAPSPATETPAPSAEAPSGEPGSPDAEPDAP